MWNQHFRWGFVLALLISCQTLAFDGNRKGLTLGGGVGVGFTGVTGASRSTDGSFALSLDLDVGYGVSEQLELYLTNKMNWLTGTSGTLSNLSASGMSCLSIRGYMSPQSPSAYLTGGLGVADLVEQSENDTRFFWGIGIFAGLGVEFSNNSLIELDYMIGNVDYRSYHIRTNSFRVMLLLTGY